MEHGLVDIEYETGAQESSSAFRLAECGPIALNGLMEIPVVVL